MISRLKFLIFLSLSFTIGANAKETTATLQVSGGGKVSVKYDATVDKDGNCSITFINVRPKLGSEYSDRLDRVKVLFFDRSGGYSEDKFSSKIDTEALRIPSDEISYKRSSDGIIWLDDQPVIRLNLLANKSSLSIPIYLAYYQKKHTYKILAACEKLNIPLEIPIRPESTVSPQKGKVTRTLTTTEEIEEDTELTDPEIAEILISRIQELLGQMTPGRVPEGLDTYVGQLRELEFKIRDNPLKLKISETLKEAENKKSECSEIESRLRQQEGEDAAARAEEKEARRNLDYLKERLQNVSDLTESDIAEMKSLANEMRRQSHSVADPQLAEEMKAVADRCDEEAKKLDDSKKRRNIWMIIGGILLSVLMLIGGQIFKHFRNLSNQKNIEEMQQKLARQAQNEAKRRARGMAYNKMAQTRNAVRGKVTNNVREGIDKVSNGKGKKVTI